MLRRGRRRAGRKRGEPDPTLVAILQLDALAKLAASDNAKIVVPYETAGLLGAAETLRSVLAATPTHLAADLHVANAEPARAPTAASRRERAGPPHRPESTPRPNG